MQLSILYYLVYFILIAKYAFHILFEFRVNSVNIIFILLDDKETMDPGFPMSNYLRSRGMQLGRNARMLSLQAPDRILEERKVPGRIRV